MTESLDLLWLNTAHPCHCGSGGHPRDCLRHPLGKALHIAELNAENSRDLCDEARAEVERQRDVLSKISAIRDLIIGFYRVNCSEHVYPLVAALDAAGFSGRGYDASRNHAGTLIEMANKADAERDAALAEVERLKGFVRDCRDNWDCDSDAHKYGTKCRACEAGKLIEP